MKSTRSNFDKSWGRGSENNAKHRASNMKALIIVGLSARCRSPLKLEVLLLFNDWRLEVLSSSAVRDDHSLVLPVNVVRGIEIAETMVYLQTFHLAHLPPSLTLHLALYEDVKNAVFLHQQLLEGNTEFEYALIDASTVGLPLATTQWGSARQKTDPPDI